MPDLIPPHGGLSEPLDLTVPAGEIHVLGRWKEKPLDKTFLIEHDPAATLRLVKDYVADQTKK